VTPQDSKGRLVTQGGASHESILPLGQARMRAKRTVWTTRSDL
jgi:hypothetical protein